MIAIALSLPIAYYVMEKWLQGFAYRIDIQWWVFIIAGAVAVLIALFKVGYQAIKTAVTNPVDSLRSE